MRAGRRPSREAVMSPPPARGGGADGAAGPCPPRAARGGAGPLSESVPAPPGPSPPRAGLGEHGGRGLAAGLATGPQGSSGTRGALGVPAAASPAPRGGRLRPPCLCLARGQPPSVVPCPPHVQPQHAHPLLNRQWVLALGDPLPALEAAWELMGNTAPCPRVTPLVLWRGPGICTHGDLRGLAPGEPPTLLLLTPQTWGHRLGLPTMVSLVKFPALLVQPGDPDPGRVPEAQRDSNNSGSRKRVTFPGELPEGQGNAGASSGTLSRTQPTGRGQRQQN
ncbi:nascent polypeptide-associated complex subunit alpha, muscle-specific form-like [Meles meles]|uniref:nascent polypeptide-associated complex subunit alpha, muscle-specific form-like n=1 Tax=Meles meles TaxID=9662 RepID=UPI001E698922|nr:nascent polypeptide-associated complex subunit alpha, muscle-specific form-like [Meles meles]